jgi:hypothetical protein
MIVKIIWYEDCYDPTARPLAGVNAPIASPTRRLSLDAPHLGPIPTRRVSFEVALFGGRSCSCSMNSCSMKWCSYSYSTRAPRVRVRAPLALSTSTKVTRFHRGRARDRQKRATSNRERWTGASRDVATGKTGNCRRTNRIEIITSSVSRLCVSRHLNRKCAHTIVT